MTLAAIQTPVVVIPETAPFSAEQRAWLSGFFAATLVPPAQGATALSLPEVAGLGAATATSSALANNDDAPWHDPAMPIADRMQLATGKPAAPRLMAAMAQQDCGQCGYNCADYANAIFEKKEARLNLCAPGGKETARMLKQLAEEHEAIVDSKAAATPMSDLPSTPAGAPGTCREAPVEVTFADRRRLNAEGSEKDTWHIEFDLANSGLSYEVGDSFGVFAQNDLGLVDQIIAMLGAAHTTEVRGRRLRDVLCDEVSLGVAPDALYELLSFISGGKQREKARALARGGDPDGDAAHIDVLGALLKFSGIRPHPEAFVDALEPLQPRLYSISSSPRHAEGRLTLTVDAVRYVIGKRRRKGVASTFLADRIDAGSRLKAYVQKAHNFALPADDNTPVIMVGPGTGIAPFRAFLQQRQAVGATGRNWLFFGHQRQMTDFFYRDELDAMQASGLLTRLSLAWSRDGAQKFYVQDRMREVGMALWQWLNDGAHFYICGDAKRMAKDVEAALVDIVAQHGGRSTEEAVAFVAGLKKSGRFQADVY